MFGGCADNAISDKKWWLIAGYQEHVNEVIIEHIRLSRSQILVLNCKSKWAENVSLIDNRKRSTNVSILMTQYWDICFCLNIPGSEFIF